MDKYRDTTIDETWNDDNPTQDSTIQGYAPLIAILPCTSRMDKIELSSLYRPTPIQLEETTPSSPSHPPLCPPVRPFIRPSMLRTFLHLGIRLRSRSGVRRYVTLLWRPRVLSLWSSFGAGGFGWAVSVSSFLLVGKTYNDSAARHVAILGVSLAVGVVGGIRLRSRLRAVRRSSS
ncbi:hypothetical protein DFP72DRAFT_881939 [Ephemerocybe angulata]|uniref:Transmembrane protein n=1 Tax=Ephemerocybe angulata TaxID=980116 RepID=A0A8H6MCN8_9AGAR|nr:hypothetical protein DFP72DRAFT_881939 [Tulosesus angulatus]